MDLEAFGGPNGMYAHQFHAKWCPFFFRPLHTHDLWGSVLEREASPRQEYVVFDGDQIYVEYILFYKRIYG